MYIVSFWVLLMSCGKASFDDDLTNWVFFKKLLIFMIYNLGMFTLMKHTTQ